MKKFALPLIAFAFIYQTTNAQNTSTDKKTETPTWGIKFSGFLRNDVFYDSRQVISARPANQGELLLYPTNVANDINGNDINAAPSVTMLSITSRLTGTITGPNAFGAKTSGIFEGEFFGNANGNENAFRLRHAYAKLDWKNTQLAFGQYWHPLFVTECFPGVVSFNTGIPFQPFSRNPQIRLTQNLGSGFNLILAAVSETEAFSSAGSSTNIALGAPSVSQLYANNAVIPNMHAQVQYRSNSLLMGAAFDFKSLRPALKVQSAPGASTYVSTNEKVNSFTFETYAKLTTKDVIVKGEFVSGENTFDQLMIGGYLAYGDAPNITYKPIHVNSYWFEVAGTGKTIVPGFFFGYTKNNGATDAGAITSVAYTRSVAPKAASIDNVLRIAPRLEIVSGKFKFGTEIEITSAAYGTAGTDAKVTGNTNSVTNTRILFVSTFSF